MRLIKETKGVFFGKEYKLRVMKDTYANNGATAIVMKCWVDEMNDWDYFGVATVNIPGVSNDKMVAIKDYSENEGVYDFLVNEGIVSKAVIWEPCGMTSVPVCEYLGA